MCFVLKETPTATLKIVDGVLWQQWLLYCRRPKNNKMYKAGGKEYWQLVWRSVPDLSKQNGS